MKYLPQITQVRNEVVFYLGVLATIALAVAEVIAGWDANDLSGWFVIVPAILGVIQRNFAYGPETVKQLKQ
jgi:7-cyano-7-deazaguanine synthase in queuosine biosynthesis